MKTIGLTGGIGSGKTFIAEVFKRIGLPVFHADLEAKNCLVEDLNLKTKIEISTFKTYPIVLKPVQIKK